VNVGVGNAFTTSFDKVAEAKIGNTAGLSVGGSVMTGVLVDKGIRVGSGVFVGIEVGASVTTGIEVGV
jgi:hypothetical protein